jgi:hypothetical protein
MPKRKSKVAAPSGAPRRPKTKRQGPRPSKSLSLRSSESIITAPSSVSASRRMTFKYSSSVVNGQSSLRVQATIPVCQIQDSGTYNNGLLFNVGTTATSASSMCLALTSFPLFSTNASTPVAGTSGAWISPHIPLMALAFDKYSIRRAGLSYEPQAATSVSDRLVLSFTEDPAHPILSPFNFVTQTAQVPSQMQQLITKDSVAFAPWRPWSLNLPVDPTPKFTFANLAEDAATVPIYQAADYRQACFGAINCVSSAGSSAVYGILYLHVELDLIDPVPLVSISSIPSFGRQLRLKREEKVVPPSICPDPVVRVVREPDDEGWSTPTPPPSSPAIPFGARAAALPPHGPVRTVGAAAAR